MIDVIKSVRPGAGLARFFRRPLPLCLAAMAGLAGAAELPLVDPAGRMQDELRRAEQSAPALPAAPKAGPVEPLLAPEAPVLVGKVRLREIVFSPSELLDVSELGALAEPYLGREVDSQELNAFLRAIQSLYLSKGIETAVPVLPQQDLRSGTMNILLVEGRLGAVRFEGAPEADRAWLGRWFDKQGGSVIGADELGRQLGVFNAASDYLAQGKYVPGDAFGRSDLQITLPDTRVSQFWSSLDVTDLSAGNSDATSLMAGYRLYPVSGYGGRFDVMAIANSTARTVSVAAGLPLGQKGWRLGLSASESRSTSTVASTTEAPDLSIDGASGSVGLELGNFVPLSGTQLLHLSAALMQMTSKSSLSGEVLSDRAVDRLTLAASTDWPARAQGVFQGASLRAAVTQGQAPAGGYRFAEASGVASFAAEQANAPVLRVSGQARFATQNNPDAIDYWLVGGSNSVRGFDSGAAYGVRGYVLQLGLYQPLVLDGFEAAQGYLLADQASAVLDGTAARIASVGLGFQLQVNRHLAVDTALTRQTAGFQGDRSRLALRLIATW
ncbi:MAG: POTRA domain-containing protein [Simplicispira sp.]|nr:POTRA domain-containing protein [Simplicispira sp.]